MATASSPWRTVSLPFYWHHGFVASIWPRHHRRGERQACGCVRQSHVGFNLATASSPWRTILDFTGRLVFVPLQFGHGIIAVENAAERFRPERRAEASIWPRHHRRGERSLQPRQDRTEAGASIWPRHHRRGEREAAPSDGVVIPGFNLATASSPWRTHPTVDHPPVGHRASIWPRHHRRGEHRGRGLRRRRRLGFNLATASSPWRT